MWPVPRRRRPASFGPGPIGMRTLVATRTRSRRPRSTSPTISSDRPAEYTSAVSIRLTPASRHMSTWRRASSTSVDPTFANGPVPPNVIVPIVSTEILRPELPSARYSTAASLAVGRPGVPRPVRPGGPGGGVRAGRVRGETDQPLVRVHGYPGEPGRGQAAGQRARVDRSADVAEVDQAPSQAGPAVRAGEHAAAPQHPRGLREQAILGGGAGQVVQHRKTHHGTERSGREPHACRVTPYHPHRAELGAEPGCEQRVVLQDGQRPRPGRQRPGARAVSGAEFEHPGPEVDPVEGARSEE